jgi:phenylalanyl-tRNA synthetase beta chain
MSSEQSQLRTTLLGSLLDVTARNRARGADAIRIFESGAVYRAKAISADTLAQEPHHIAALLTGPVRLPTWRDQRPPQADFFTAKGVLAALLGTIGVEWDVITEPARPAPFLHPGRAAGVVAGGETIGWLGEIHPGVAAEWDLDVTIAGFEIDLSAIAPPEPVKFRDLVSFPAVHEDLAIVVAEPIATSELLRVIREAGVPLIERAEVFDIYRDEQRLGAGRKSVAVRLSFRAADRTLTDDEVARQRQFIVNAIAKELEGAIRTGD